MILYTSANNNCLFDAFSPYGLQEELYKQIQQSFSDIPNIEEKKMFSEITFMVNGKICVSVGPDKIICRIDPQLHDEALKKKRK